ncbi:hypothetical protein ACFLYR_07390 [Chloroflexota bacterium]
MQAQIEDGLLSATDTMRVQIGDVGCLLICRDAEVFGNLKNLYRNFLTLEPADISFELEPVERMNSAEIEAALDEMRFTHEGNHFTSTNLIITGEHNLTGRTISMTVEKRLLSSDVGPNYVNRALSLAYYTACKVRYNGNPPALLVHSCGILRHGQALLFVGPCGAGKTTIARLCGMEYGQVLNDEAVLVSRPHQSNDALRVQGVPMIGELHQRLNIAAPLRCVLLLKQSKKTDIHRLDRMEAYLSFMRQVWAPAYIGQRDRRAIYSLIAEFSDEVTRTTPFYELEFSLDKESLWEVVAELEGELERRE